MLHMSSPLNARLQRASAENLLEEGISYNRQCYEDLTNKAHIDRANARYKKVKEHARTATISKQKKARRPSFSVYLNSCQHLPYVILEENEGIDCF